MVAEHLPILPVLIPLLAAPIAILVGRSSLAWLLSTSASIAAFFVAIGLLELTLANGAIRYALGGWSPPWGIEMRIDVASAFVLLAVSGISSLVLIYARASIEKEIKEGQHTMPESKRLRGGIARPIPGARPTACFATKIIPDDFVEPR